MRIISGNCRGRKLIPLEGRQIRPTSDRVKEALFNIIGPRISGSSVLDLFSGTGALGIEALSRGAAHVVFMDKRCDITLKNLELCGLTEAAHVVETDILNQENLYLTARQQFDFIFIDPPYGKGYIEMVLENPSFMDLLHDGSIIMAEHDIREKLEINLPGLDIFRQKKYSKTMISFLQKQMTKDGV